MKRVLITGSRTWTDRHAILLAVLDVWDVATVSNHLVEWHHGACPDGADALADEILTQFGFRPVRHPAEWQACRGVKCTPRHRQRRASGGTYCPTAGLDRDALMVEQGPDLVLAFIDPCAKPTCRKKKPHGSHGATYTADLAEQAGIETLRWPW